MDRRLVILSLITLLIVLPLGACGYSQEQLQEAWDKGHETGYALGYENGWDDAPKPTPTTPVIPPTPSAKLFVGSVNSDIYHYPSCEWAKKISPQNEIWFSSVADAHSRGYRACKVCRPPS